MRHPLGIAVFALAAGLLAAGCNPPATSGGPGAGSPAGAQAGKPTEVGVQDLEAKLKANPGDAALKQQTAEANYQLGHSMMLDPDLQPRVKYRGALKYFRRAMELNPKHEQAASERKTIEDIYTQMGRPIPQ